MKDKEILKEAGFTDGEIKVYFGLFELGETTVGPISKVSGVTHAKVYPILEKLIDKGLVSHVIKEGRKHFSVTNPNSILEFVDNKIIDLNSERDKIKEIIPSLIKKQKEHQETQHSRVFEGFRGLRSLFHELFEEDGKDSEILVLGLNEILKQSNFINFFRFYHDLRRKHKIKLRLILNKNIRDFVKKEYQTAKMYSSKDEVRYVGISFPAGIFIFRNHVITIVSREKVTAFDIKSEQNFSQYKEYFDEIWKIAKR
tara:strand:- start:1146 stop:1913 length:768 start_codon:yes stop_codon:yes gene_type:complete